MPRYALHLAILCFVIVWQLHAQSATQPSKTLALRVIDRESGEPLAKVKVDLNTDGQDAKLTTDDEGNVALPVPAKAGGFFGAQLHLDGYVDKRLSWRDIAKEPLPDKYTVKLEQGTEISGRVVDDSGAAVAGATVVVLIPDRTASNEAHERNSVSFKSIKSAQDGSWKFNGAPADFEYAQLGVWHYSYACGQYYELKRFTPEQMRSGAQLILARGVPIEGVVLDTDGKPIKGARVTYGGEMASNKMPAQKTDDTGKFAYAAKPGEEVVLTVACKGYAPELQAFRMGDEKQQLTITLSPSKAMFGKVVGPDGEPVASAWVYPDTWRGHRSLTTRIHADKEGKFRWADAPTDSVKCDVDGSSSGYVRETVDLTGSDEELVVTLRKALHVTGTASMTSPESRSTSSVS